LPDRCDGVLPPRKRATNRTIMTCSGSRSARLVLSREMRVAIGMTEHERLMDIAIEEAKAGAVMREQPFGAVVAIEGRSSLTAIVSRSRRPTTAHSERLAIAVATRKLRWRSLPQAVFHATCEPCPMCLGAIFNAGIATWCSARAAATSRAWPSSPSISRIILRAVRRYGRLRSHNGRGGCAHPSASPSVVALLWASVHPGARF
jgi:tRNA(Arg) A34 adenosine deaminase TadA